MVPIDLVIEAVLISEKLSEIYQIKNKSQAKKRVEEMRIVNQNFFTFSEFVKFLYLDNNVKKLTP